MRRLLLIPLLSACASPLPDLPEDGGSNVLRCYRPGDAGIFATGLPDPSPGCATAPDAGTFDLSSLGTNFWHGPLVVPPAPAGAALPVVFVFHGAGGTGAGARQAFGLEGPADGGAIFVYPNAAAGTWDIRETSIDGSRVQGILRALSERYCVDRTRVSIAGFSAGAVFTLYLGCNVPGTFQGLAAVAGTESRFDTRCCTEPISALEIHGEEDSAIPFTEGRGAVAELLGRDGCTRSDATPDGAQCTAYACPSPWAVDFCPWPGDHEVPDFAGAEIWRFLSRLPPRVPSPR